MRITDEGNIGVGVTDPQEKLQVDGKISASAFTSQSPLVLESPSGTEHLRINQAGYVGIGTQTPQAKLHVEGSIQGEGDIVATGKVTASAFTSQSPLVLEAPEGLERMRITDDYGNVGTGTQAPEAKLHVVGDLEVTGRANVRRGVNGGFQAVAFAVYRNNYVQFGSGNIFIVKGDEELSNGDEPGLHCIYVTGITDAVRFAMATCDAVDNPVACTIQARKGSSHLCPQPGDDPNYKLGDILAAGHSGQADVIVKTGNSATSTWEDMDFSVVVF